MSDVPILVCGCGKRLRAPGAVPGRVGRCPACGGELRVPEAAPTAPADDAVGPEAPSAWPTARVATRAKGKKTRRGRGSVSTETAIWDGLVRAPSRPETRLRDSLLYPLWGATGVALLVLGPPLLWLTSVPLITAVAASSATTSGTPFGLGLLFLLLPATIGLAVLLAYALLFLARVLASSALGEVHHPRWPDWDLLDMASGLGRWVWAGLVGVVVGGLPAVVYWISCGDIDLFDIIILAELLAAGAVYALMALLASILHEDMVAANPVTVVGAIRRVGWGYVQPCLVSGFAVSGAATVFSASFEVESPAFSAFLLWLFWFVVLYEAMVTLRVLGLFYHQHARALGWFRDRTRWGV